MSESDAFERILEVLNAAMLDEAQWSLATALVEEACGAVGSGVMVAEETEEGLRLVSFSMQVRGDRLEELERDYLAHYYRTDERMARCEEMDYGRLIPVADTYTEEERKTSPAYNEFLPRIGAQQGVSVRLRGPVGYSHIAWAFGDPIVSGGWGSDQLAMMGRLLPQVGQLVAVRRLLADAGALGTSLTGLLDNARVGVIHLNQYGRIVAANDRASSVLRRGAGLTDHGGFLHATLPANNTRLARLLAGALGQHGGAAEAGAMVLHGPPTSPRIIMHVKPAVSGESAFGAWGVSALVLFRESGRKFHIDSSVVASALGLTRAETQVAVWIAEGTTVREIAEATGRKESSVYWHLRQIYQKLGISRQAELVRLVLSLSDFV